MKRGWWRRFIGGRDEPSLGPHMPTAEDIQRENTGPAPQGSERAASFTPSRWQTIGARLVQVAFCLACLVMLVMIVQACNRWTP